MGYVNGVLKTQVDKYAKNYSYIVMDNEAGLEHVARGTLPHVDTMLLISDCSRRGIQAVARIAEMIQIIGDRADGKLPPPSKIKTIFQQFCNLFPKNSSLYMKEQKRRLIMKSLRTKKFTFTLVVFVLSLILLLSSCSKSITGGNAGDAMAKPENGYGGFDSGYNGVAPMPALMPCPITKWPGYSAWVWRCRRGGWPWFSFFAATGCSGAWHPNALPMRRRLRCFCERQWGVPLRR